MGRISSLFSLYDGGQNVPWVIPISLFTCKFKYTAACTDKTLPRSFLTLVLLTSISHILGGVVRFCLAPNLNLCTGEAAKMNSQHFRAPSEKENVYVHGRVAGVVPFSDLPYALFFFPLFETLVYKFSHCFIQIFFHLLQFYQQLFFCCCSFFFFSIAAKHFKAMFSTF